MPAYYIMKYKILSADNVSSLGLWGGEEVIELL